MRILRLYSNGLHDFLWINGSDWDHWAAGMFKRPEKPATTVTVRFDDGTWVRYTSYPDEMTVAEIAEDIREVLDMAGTDE